VSLLKLRIGMRDALATPKWMPQAHHLDQAYRERSTTGSAQHLVFALHWGIPARVVEIINFVHLFEIINYIPLTEFPHILTTPKGG
jgi:hypothetical protein